MRLSHRARPRPSSANGSLGVVVNLDNPDDGGHSVAAGVGDGASKILGVNRLSGLLRLGHKRLLALDPLARRVQKRRDQSRAEVRIRAESLNHRKSVTNQRRARSLHDTFEVCILAPKKRVVAVLAGAFDLALGCGQRRPQLV